MTWRTIGHSRAIAALRSDLAEGRSAHAYLFAGPPGIGKATLAGELAQALNCERGPRADAPCGDCRACTRIAAGGHADVETLTPRSPCEVSDHDHSRDTTASLRICQVRRVDHTLVGAPYEGRMRVIIVDPADALTTEAANAFLKTLEEPPPNATIVLVATSAEALLPTIRSRCRTVTLQSVPEPALRAALIERWGASEEEAARIAALALGRPGWARAALDDSGLLDERATLVRRVQELSDAPRDERLAYAEELANRWPAHRDDVRDELDIWQEWWRDVLVVRAGRPDLAIHKPMADELSIVAAEVETIDALDFIESVRATLRHVEANANTRLAFDVLMLGVPRRSARKGNPAAPAPSSAEAQAASR